MKIEGVQAWVCSLYSLVHLFSRIWMKLCESQIIWLTIWLCSHCSPCSIVHKDFNSFSKVFEFVHFVHLVHLFLMIWMKLSESQFIWLSIWVCSLFSPCSLVLDDMNEAFWNSIHLTKYLSLFTLFTLFTCSRGFE